ncbi:MAG: Tex family protein [Bacteroidales bacterium]|nr:Tex family protein [Bacteroidales bacterium]MDD4235122.1 Tex family protein [Bacteroidales bacterium]
MDAIIQHISKATDISTRQVMSVIHLLEQGSSIPFISRYRKEQTGGLNEVEIGNIKINYDKFVKLSERRNFIIESIDSQDKLSEELKTQILDCWDPVVLEDLYLPYKPKRKTKASIARENKLEPLADRIMQQADGNVEEWAKHFVTENVKTTDEALQGARDIIAEIISENRDIRNTIRKAFDHSAVISSKLVKTKEEEAQKYQDYFEFSEKLSKCPSHRLLAIRRGENEGVLRVDISPDNTRVIESLNRMLVKRNNAAAEQVELAISDSYKRLLKPSIENEYANISKEKADLEAIEVFAQNLKQLLLSPPLGQKRVLAIDPGFRTGCKLVVLDAQGNLMHNENIYPHKPQEDRRTATRKLVSLVDMYDIEAIAIGNGTASRETESFIKRIRFSKEIKVFVVSEDGASIYSASAIAREEFPKYDVTVRGAVSIGRRLMDPLAELVKIDPKSIGIGQYQHDVDQKLLKESLDTVVESCVNNVGVDLNTASRHLLTYVSGLGTVLAQNIVDYRKENGAFSNRAQLLKVPRLGNKAFEQCAGFLRIRNGENLLDNTAVHPESYHIVEKMASDQGSDILGLIENQDLRTKIDLNKYVDGNIGIPTLTDIMKELEKPGRDIRETIKVFEFAENVFDIDDLEVGMVLPGIVTNITKFGAFVDIGIKQNGLIHVSNMADRFIKDPAEVVNLHQHLKVKVISIDFKRERIQLSLKDVD